MFENPCSGTICGKWLHGPRSCAWSESFYCSSEYLIFNAIVTRANQLWIHGFANASSRLLFSRIFCSWMCANSLSPENEEGRHRRRWSFRVMRQCCSASNYMGSHSRPQHNYLKAELITWLTMVQGSIGTAGVLSFEGCGGISMCGWDVGSWWLVKKVNAMPAGWDFSKNSSFEASAKRCVLALGHFAVSTCLPSEMRMVCEPECECP